MLFYAITVTFILGLVIGMYGTVILALHMERKDDRRRQQMRIHPSTRVGRNPFVPN